VVKVSNPIAVSERVYVYPPQKVSASVSVLGLPLQHTLYVVTHLVGAAKDAWVVRPLVAPPGVMPVARGLTAVAKQRS
jgi:hypothetical protein